MKNCILLFFIPFILQSQESYIVGDVDCNSVLNSEDASLILQYVTGSVETLPCQENLIGLTSDQLQEIVDMISSVGVHNDTISMFGPMYLYSECDENCLDVDYIFGAQESNEIYYFEALAFCAQLEYEGFTDWELPTISALYYWVSQNNSNIIPIVCIGETLNEKEEGITTDILKNQLKNSIPQSSNFNNTIIAYEPVWAIGTGLTPTIQEIDDTHRFIREHNSKFNQFKILYGGSVKSNNVKEITSLSKIIAKGLPILLAVTLPNLFPPSGVREKLTDGLPF